MAVPVCECSREGPDECSTDNPAPTVHVQCESNPLQFSDNFFPNVWEFIINFLHTYYTFLISTLDYKFFYSIISNFDEVMAF